MKRFLILLLIVGLAEGAIFGLFAMNHHGAYLANGHCPTASLYSSTCPDGALTAVQHYISMYQAFTDGVVSLMITHVLVALALFVVVAYWLRRFLVRAPNLFILSRSFCAKLYRPKALTRWLSLLVNSPSTI
ncbi:MAG: hypothetical protein HZB12_00610 [Candidatus Yonathbacteria bacterium]|nr:hypothetical protein [Candidatus Yonathbacteria bacterium]